MAGNGAARCCGRWSGSRGGCGRNVSGGRGRRWGDGRRRRNGRRRRIAAAGGKAFGESLRQIVGAVAALKASWRGGRRGHAPECSAWTASTAGIPTCQMRTERAESCRDCLGPGSRRLMASTRHLNQSVINSCRRTRHEEFLQVWGTPRSWPIDHSDRFIRLGLSAQLGRQELADLSPPRAGEVGCIPGPVLRQVANPEEQFLVITSGIWGRLRSTARLAQRLAGTGAASVRRRWQWHRRRRAATASAAVRAFEHDRPNHRHHCQSAEPASFTLNYLLDDSVVTQSITHKLGSRLRQFARTSSIQLAMSVNNCACAQQLWHHRRT